MLTSQRNAAAKRHKRIFIGALVVETNREYEDIRAELVVATPAEETGQFSATLRDRGAV